MSTTPIFENSEYQAHSAQLKLTEDIYNGTDSAVAYLRRFPKEETSVYAERQTDGSIDNYVKRTAETTRNIIFRKELDLEGLTNSEVQRWAEKIDFTNNLNEFAKITLLNRIRDGYTFILVDSIKYDSEEITTKLQQEEKGIRPYFVNILRKNVINWTINSRGEYEVFTIKEIYEEKTNPYRTETKEQYRVFHIDGLIEIWRDGALYDLFETGAKTITIVKIGNDLIPPLYDQAKINIQHMNRHSECNNYVRVGASPFLAVFGSLDGDSPKTLGINSGLKFADKDSSDVKWIEMTGSNYQIIQEWMSVLVGQMDNISIEFATELKSATATEVEKASMSSESKLSNYSSELEDGLNLALEYLGLYKDSLGLNTVEVNKDFSANILTIEQFNMLMQLRTNGEISNERLMKAIERGEVLPLLTEKERAKEDALRRNEGTI